MATSKKVVIARPSRQQGQDTKPAPGPQRPRQNTRAQRKNNGIKTKFVIRRLPPLYTQAEFQDLTAEFINVETTEWTYFVPGKLHKRPETRLELTSSKSTPMTYSRAYAKFKDLAVMLAFNKAFAGKVVKDAKGNESTLQIEFAPFDRIPSLVEKLDPKQGTIDEDPEYVAFVQSLSAPVQPLAPLTPTSNDSALDNKEIVTTPLIEFLRAKKLTNPSKKQKKEMTKIEREALQSVKKSKSGKATPAAGTTTAPTSDSGEREKSKRTRRKKKKEPVVLNDAQVAIQADSEAQPETSTRPVKKHRNRGGRGRRKEGREAEGTGSDSTVVSANAPQPVNEKPRQAPKPKPTTANGDTNGSKGGRRNRRGRSDQSQTTSSTTVTTTT
ncbi:Smg-4/UPF3 family-domain-containing protein [Lipomyces arxii]|uniref:Smg-4/UPF3 family-domain-containing protein n=1 Tax=Lipomyces arxii TaxID=56418 RepID=UPI0034CE1BF3